MPNYSGTTLPAFEAPLYLKNGIFKGLLVDVCNDIIMCYFQKISRETNKKKNKQWGRLKEHAATRVATTSILGPAFLTLTLLRAPAIENSEILKKMVVFSPPSRRHFLLKHFLSFSLALSHKNQQSKTSVSSLSSSHAH